MSTLTEIKKGVVIKYNDEPYVVMEANFLRMQQRKPVMQTRLKNLSTGRVVEYSFKQGEKIEPAEVNHRQASFLYKDGNKYYFMDNQEYDQFFLEENLIEENKNFLTESLLVDLLYFEERIIGIELPPKVVLKVVEAPEGVRGDSAGAATKTVVTETGFKLNAPMFIKEGDKIKVNTETGEYVERA